jgi:prevent-host-death family protein
MAATMINVHEAKTHLSRILARVEAGEEIVLMRAGHPVARVIPFKPDVPARTPGAWAGRVRIAEDFDALPDEVEAAFRGLLP